MSARRVRWAAIFGLGVGAAVACGGKTGLDLDDFRAVEGEPAAPIGTIVAPPDAAPPPAQDAALDADAAKKPDAFVEAGFDAPADVAVDLLPEADAPAVKADCVDPMSTWVYVVTDAAELYGYDPSTGIYHPRGLLDCPSTTGATPFSMAVNRTGTAFVVYSDGQLYRVSTKTAACSATSYVPGAFGFTTFGMGFATIEQGPDENLYVAQTPEGVNTGDISALGTIDTKTFSLDQVGNFAPPLIGAELTGTGDGRLFGFVMDPTDLDKSRIVQIDKKTAEIVADVPVPGVMIANGWAFAFWGGQFYTFTAPGGMPGVPTLTRYDPATGETMVLGAPPGKVVGAGVSTCAPEQ